MLVALLFVCAQSPEVADRVLKDSEFARSRYVKTLLNEKATDKEFAGAIAGLTGYLDPRIAPEKVQAVVLRQIGDAGAKLKSPRRQAGIVAKVVEAMNNQPDGVDQQYGLFKKLAPDSLLDATIGVLSDPKAFKETHQIDVILAWRIYPSAKLAKALPALEKLREHADDDIAVRADRVMRAAKGK